ncbi:flagellar protein FliT [Bacillus sp. DTU_2020_1000418_1_SI_GHA_SEK_038]|uniref:flagellar protein FliT n=1 Tax=Bacillus sp. DTU_2020_1000418_1_SI_GHA_SEK_038 TaxID=3077585 RepID=UPI0028E44ACF|nr:flagellar protein FliT [Bacillus sp. DTU_2020_1000418_1_SI_GHA_SEK_038]WNS75076.1 flagellar protein FliT [Bacillus sp. DTU_2020_1000418_1_SI_GHA_SEK_038]
MGPVHKIIEVTLQLINTLQDEVDRDEKIMKVDHLLEKREGLLKQLESPYSQEEMAAGKQVIELSKQLKELLLKEKLSIQHDIKTFNQKKETSSKYIHSYESISTDGIFYDKRN